MSPKLDTDGEESMNRVLAVMPDPDDVYELLCRTQDPGDKVLLKVLHSRVQRELKIFCNVEQLDAAVDLLVDQGKVERVPLEEMVRRLR
jgi:hypothetical protein